MVAISLYRGNLHRVPNVTRRLIPPKRQISLKDFKTLLSRRARALSRLNSPSSSNPNPNPNPNPSSVSDHLEESPEEKIDAVTVKEEPDKLADDCGGGKSGERNDEEEAKPDVSPAKPIVESDCVADFKFDSPERASDRVDDGEKPPVVAEAQKVEEFGNSEPEMDEKEELDDGKLKRKKEIEEKLQVLTDKKHVLVQLLKQVLSAEEELKRRMTVQGVGNRPPAPLQVDAMNDSVSMTRHFTPRMGAEPNVGGADQEGAEGDGLSNQNLHSRQIFRMNSTSPSSESPIRRPPYLQHNTGLHPTSRTSLGATSSPSRFTPAGHPANIPTISVSGTNYIASSPSPAASGGTSTFRDSRLPSPWN